MDSSSDLSKSIARKIARGAYHGKRTREKAWRRYRRAIMGVLRAGLRPEPPVGDDRAAAECFACLRRHLGRKRGAAFMERVQRAGALPFSMLAVSDLPPV
jgi:hypothetical protein